MADALNPTKLFQPSLDDVQPDPLQVVPMIPFLGGGSRNLVNYDFFDVAAGTGYATYYGGVASGANILSNNKFYSDKSSTGALIPSTNFSKLIDMNFDVPFNIPVNMKGTAIINVPMAINQTSGLGRTFYGFIIARIRKWDGATQTDIAAEGSNVWLYSGANGTTTQEKYAVARPIIPITHFKAGETLRITIEGYGKASATGTDFLIIGHEPMNILTKVGELNCGSYGNFPFVSGAIIFNAQIPLKIDI